MKNTLCEQRPNFKPITDKTIRGYKEPKIRHCFRPVFLNLFASRHPRSAISTFGGTPK